jgi:hypothetical protein
MNGARAAVITLTGGGLTRSVILTQGAWGTGQSNEPVEPTDVRYANGILTVNTPRAEGIDVYSVGGLLLYQAQKLSGDATFSLRHLPHGVLIVRGGSGWTGKIVNSEQ